MCKNVPVNLCPETVACWDNGQCSCGLCNRCNMWFPCILSQLSDFCHTEVHTFCAPCHSTYKSLFSTECTKDFRCPYSQKSRGLKSRDHADRLTGSLHPVHFSFKDWFRYSLTVQRKLGGATACMNHMLCCWRRGTCFKSTGKSL
jgi:hypothetical protein